MVGRLNQVAALPSLTWREQLTCGCEPAALVGVETDPLAAGESVELFVEDASRFFTTQASFSKLPISAIS
jgi:hypothetical protein